MILELKRISRSPEYTYTITQRDSIVGSASFPVHNQKSIDPKIKVFSSSMQLCVPTWTYALSNPDGVVAALGNLCMDGQPGKITTQIVGKGIFSRYIRYNIFWGELSLQAYEIGFGRKGIYFVLKSGDTTLAVISKAMRTVNYLSAYKLYIEDESLRGMTVLLALYWDVTNYLQSLETSLAHIEYHRLDTIQKGLKKHYDPTFIPRIESMES
ncbi:MAG: hypothetical protein LBM69_00995 [Lachnospiraceae bacterium]|jgi:hypothetical protein|nr:hypothetical protein [Lachnospiraceae bacterium]